MMGRLPTFPTLRDALAQAERHVNATHARKLAADRAYSAACNAWMEAEYALNAAVQREGHAVADLLDAEVPA